MKRFSTDRLLTIGMALTGDKRAMERRVRGVFARRKSARAAKLGALALCLLLGAACFTTACQPQTTPASDGNAVFASGGNAVLASGGNAVLASEGDAVPAAAAADSDDPRASMLDSRQDERTAMRRFLVPRIQIYYDGTGGDFAQDASASAADAKAAMNAFFATANTVFGTSYSAADSTAAYYKDSTGFRADVWRIDTKDGALSGAIEANTLRFLSAVRDCEPSEKANASIVGMAGEDAAVVMQSLDRKDLTARLEAAFGALSNSEVRTRWFGKDADAGYNILYWQEATLADGQVCRTYGFADEALTIDSVALYPDEICASEDVYWRADLRWHVESEVAVPQDFRKGEPGADDMPVQQAYDFYYKLVSLAGSAAGSENDPVKEPNATFYVDYSGARENYWHIEGELATFDLTSRTGHMFNLSCDRKLGTDMGLMEIPYEKMGGDEYLTATRTLFVGLYGAESIEKVMLNAVYDYHYCTVDVALKNGTAYELMFQDGLISEATYFSALDRMGWGIDPNWAADWIYRNLETGETFHMDW